MHVAAGQWEFQCFAKGAKAAGDEIWVARYFLERLAEEYDLPKVILEYRTLAKLKSTYTFLHSNHLQN